MMGHFYTLAEKTLYAAICWVTIAGYAIVAHDLTIATF